MSLDRAGNLHAIVLAAGSSSRFGSPKQLVRFEGRSLLQRSLACAAEIAGPAVSVVLGANAAQVAAALPAGAANLVLNRGWSEGLASSIRAGVRQLPGACDGVLLLLADQPLVTVAALNRLAAMWRREPLCIVASQYSRSVQGGITGVPAIFPRWAFADLSALRGDQGARGLMHRYPDRLRRVLVPEAAVDIDRPEDLLELHDDASVQQP